MTTTRVYIDGFNLYHGIIHKNRFHWLDLQKFAEKLNRDQPVSQIIYCTAMVSGTPNDPDKAIRQEIYHRALLIACPRVEILMGQFTTHKKLKPIAGCHLFPTCGVRVDIRNEKGSDVNLASRLLHDAHTSKYDRAIVISGDSDLVEPIRLVTQEIGKTVWVRNPRDTHSQELDRVASEYTRIRPAVLQDSQLPNRVTDGTKVYQKPPKWSTPATVAAKKDVLAVSCPETGCTKNLKTCRYV